MSNLLHNPLTLTVSSMTPSAKHEFGGFFFNDFLAFSSCKKSCASVKKAVHCIFNNFILRKKISGWLKSVFWGNLETNLLSVGKSPMDRLSVRGLNFDAKCLDQNVFVVNDVEVGWGMVNYVHEHNVWDIQCSKCTVSRGHFISVKCLTNTPEGLLSEILNVTPIVCTSCLFVQVIFLILVRGILCVNVWMPVIAITRECILNIIAIHVVSRTCFSGIRLFLRAWPRGVAHRASSVRLPASCEIGSAC